MFHRHLGWNLGRRRGLAYMRNRLPNELGDALLVAAGVITLALFGALYFTLPATTVDVQAMQESQTVGQGR